jgi:hypothetical protein
LLAFVGGMLVDSVDMRYPAMDADGFLAPQTATPLIDPATAHSQLASYWRDAKRTGAVPPSDVFEPGVWTTDYAQTLTQYGQGQVARNGLVGHYAYQADPAHDPLFTFPEGQGWQLACSALRVQTTFSGADASDGPVQDHARDNWGPEIAPGVYRSIVYTDVATPCIDIPPAGSGQLVRVHGAARHTSVSVGLP